MTLDLCCVIEGESGSDPLMGAVILTFTLNLNFYEQIVAQSLDRAGSSHILILADADGYAGAMEMGAKSVTGAGMRYVCVPFVGKGPGVQHVKLILLAGPRRGRLLIGSGNLTLHGYGRNLELFSLYEYDETNPEFLSHYAFAKVWQLLLQIRQTNRLPGAAIDQLDRILALAPWLESKLGEPPDFRVWHSFEESIWKQLRDWRMERGLYRPLRYLKIISPYYDRDINALNHLTDSMQPAQVEVYLDPASTNFQGQAFASTWAHPDTAIKLNGLTGKAEKRKRPLHAKAIIGVEGDGSWCLTGSANLSSPGLEKSWQKGGNLELVTLRWEPNPNAFDYLFQGDGVHVWEIDAAEITGEEKEPSERLGHADSGAYFIELTIKGSTLEGKLSNLPDHWPHQGVIRLLRSGLEIPVTVQASLIFTAGLPRTLQEAEAACLILGEHLIPYRWIDHPDALARFGVRAYYARVGAKLETFDGAGKLFQELMDFVWQRVDPHKITEENEPIRIARRQRYGLGPYNAEVEAPAPPPPEEFITEEELVNQLARVVGYQKPYDRSIWSLRDLISLALLRLTTPITPPELLAENGAVDEARNQLQSDQRERDRISILTNLRNYVVHYSKRYGERLTDADFVRASGPELLLQNHFTLGRILVEFADKVDQFTGTDLRNCFWWVWAPLTWPRIVAFRGTPTLATLLNMSGEESVARAWREAGLPTLTAIIMTRALGSPPESRDGIGDLKKVQQFLAAREFISQLRRLLGNSALTPTMSDWPDASGFRSISELSVDSDETASSQIQELLDRVEGIASFRSPTERRYTPLRELQQLDEKGKSRTVPAVELVNWFKLNKLDQHLQFRGRHEPILPLNWGAEYCPKCFLKLPERDINRLSAGHLVLCSASHDALVYWQPQLPQSVI